MKTSHPRVLLAGVGVALETQLRAGLASTAVVVASAEDYDDAKEHCRRQALDAVVILLDPDPSAAFRLLSWVVAEQPKAIPIALARKKDPDWILHAMREGARQFAVLDPQLTDLRRVLKEITAAAQPAQVGGSGRVLTVYGSKGGLGATTVAVNLAGALASLQRRVVVVDLDLELGAVPVLLDVRPTYTITDVLQNMARLDRDLLGRTLPRHSSGVQVLSQAERIEDVDQIRAPQVSALLKFLRTHYDDVVVDGLHGFNELSLAALDESDRIYLLVTQEVPSVRNAQRALGVFNRLGYTPERVQILVNRFHKSSRIRLEDITITLGREIAQTIGNDYPTVIKCIDEGNLLVQQAARTRVAEDLAQMARNYVGQHQAPVRKGGWLRGLVGRFGDEAKRKAEDPA